jgi:4a-hydroxytetrahydrobiopterin dehydratase
MRHLQQYRGFEIQETLKPITQTEGWVTDDNSLYKKYVFADFNVAMEFMNEVAEVCNQMDHHPKWTNIYKEVECWLRTHDAGDVVTDKDHELAQAMDRIASRLL